MYREREREGNQRDRYKDNREKRKTAMGKEK